MGTHSGAYRDLNINMLTYNGRHYNALDIFNLFLSNRSGTAGPEPLSTVETFNAAVAYLGTYLHNRGLSFDFVNSFQEEKALLAEKLLSEDIRAVAVITTLYVAVSPIIEIVNFIRSYHRTVKIIIGGPFVYTKLRTIAGEERDSFFDLLGADFYVNSPQGETALVSIIDALNNNLSLAGIPNIYYKNGKGNRYAATAAVPEKNNLSENSVNWDLFAGKTGKFVNVRTALSCPFSCAFCAFPLHAGTYQTMSVDKVEHELNRLEKMGTVKSITFIDDTFNIPQRRFKEILKMMIRNSYTFRWNSFLRSQFIDEEVVKLMKDSGCESVFLGLESADSRVLKNMNKKASITGYREGIALLKKYNITTFGNFLIGFPGETTESVLGTVRFIKESELDFYRTQLWYCDPITPVCSRREYYNLKGEHFEWQHDTMNSKTASDLLEKMIIDIEKPARYPQYYFDYDRILQLTHKGLSMEQVKEFLRAFNNGIKEKLLHPSQQEMSYEVVERIVRSCRENQKEDSPKKENTAAGEAQFDF